jgi:hypothetical protein
MILAKTDDFTSCGYTKEQLKCFWVGLMDGDGSIQVNHWRKQCLQYRFVIKLEHTPANKRMLNIISKVVKGQVRVSSDDKWVLWVENRKSAIQALLEVFNVCPPLTTRLYFQIKFLKECLLKDDVVWYLHNRDQKYRERLSFKVSEDVEKLAYFSPWLSGFIEAEGCFSVGKNKRQGSFSIGQKNDGFILKAIARFFDIRTGIRESSKSFYLLETFKEEVLLRVQKHFESNPLLGQKSISFVFFLDKKSNY